MKIFLRRHSLGIPARLTMLALVTALPLVAVGSFAILRSVDDERAQIRSRLNERCPIGGFGQTHGSTSLTSLAKFEARCTALGITTASTWL